MPLMPGYRLPTDGQQAIAGVSQAITCETGAAPLGFWWLDPATVCALSLT
jgi:hypothetical protein